MTTGPGRLAFVYSGQGGQWPGMGRDLYEEEPAFRRALDACAAAVRRQAGWSLRDELWAPPDRSRLAELRIAQPAVLAVQVALTHLWRSRGVAPDAVAGYSIGDAAACWAAGVLGLEAACRVLCRQGELLDRIRGEGGMLAVELPPEEARREAGAAGAVLAAESGPGSSVLAGDPGALAAVERALAGRGVFCRRVAIEAACHGPQVEPLAAELERLLGGLKPRAGRLPVYSGLTGEVLRGEWFGAAYWPRALRRPVRFAPALERLLARGFDRLVEIGPHPVLLPAVRQGLGDRNVTLLAAMRRQEGGRRALAEALRGLPAGEAAGDAARAALLAVAPGDRGPLLAAEIARRVAGLLGIAPEEVARDRPLAALGLDSLRTAELRQRLASDLGIRAGTAELLAAGSLDELTDALAGRLGAPEAAGPEPGAVAAEPPLSPGQRALWFIERLAPGNSAYNLAVALWVRSPLDVEALARAAAALARRHPCLRATVHARDGAPFQRVAAKPEVGFLAEDAAAWPEGAVARRLAAEAARPFDLETGPLLRLAVLSPGSEDHALLLAAHHLACDLWSVAVMVRDLGAFYAAEAGGGPARLPALPVGYADWVRWQGERLAGEEGERLWGYWREKLAAPPVLALPTDRPRPPVQTFRGAARTLRLPAATAEALRQAAGALGATPFMALAAGFAALLGRLSGQEDLLMGSPAAGRGHPALTDLVGYFVNPLVLRADLAGDPAFPELLARTRRTVLEALEHRDLPFPSLVERLQPERDPSRSPLFQVFLAWEQSPFAGQEGLAACLVGVPGVAVALGPLAAESLPLAEGAAQFDLGLVAAEVAGTMALSLQHNADLFDGATAGRWLGHLATLLAAAAAEPGRHLSLLPLLAPAERHQLLREWNDTAAPFPRDLCLHELVAAQAARTPDGIALVAADGALSYGELARRAGRLARRLRALGVGPEVRVGLCAGRSLEMVVGLLAVLEAGGAYVPLDPAFPPQRLALVLEDAAVPVLLAERELLPRLPPAGARIVLLEEEGAAGDGGDDGGRALAENLAYVLYTSGSTGRPKGIEVAHRSMVNFLLAMARGPGLGSGDRLLSVTTISFDIFGLELFLPLAVGAQVILAGREQAADPALLGRALRHAGATALQATPATWRMLVEAGRVPCGPFQVLCGGEALPPGLAALLAERGRTLWNLYGPTETTIWSARRRIGPGEGGPVPIGRPIANTSIHLLDRAFDPVPAGAVGELCIGGEGLARGYLGRPDLTAERFVPDPFGGPGERLYRTGDLARRRPDGELEHLGRVDQQVKVRGFRIEPGEIEAQLAKHPAIAQAAVVLREDAPGLRRLVAYVVPAVAEAPPASALRAFLAERLPEYMVPAAFVPLDRLPLTPNGKLDRRALPASAALPPETAAMAPRTRTEQALARVWAEVLRLPAVAADADFFALGGDSVLSVRAVALAAREGLRLAPRDLFRHRTVAALARALDEGAVKPGQEATGEIMALPAAALALASGRLTPAAVPLAAGLDQERLDLLAAGFPGLEDAYPLTPMQEGMLFHTLAAPGSGVYLQQLVWTLTGPLDAAAFREAWQGLLERHAALRTAVAWRGLPRPLQVVCRGAALPWSAYDWRGLPAAAQEARWTALLAADRALGFDLERPPLLRLALVRLGESEHRLLWSHHHLLLDGWSIQLLQEELLARCEALRRRQAPAADVPRPFRDFLAWLAAKPLPPAEAYWRRALAGFGAPTPLPCERPGGGSGEGGERRAARERRLSATAASALAAFCRRRQLTLGSLLQGAWALLLARCGGEDEVVFGITTSGRPGTLAGSESMIGLFINTLPLRLRCAWTAPAAAWLGQVQERQVEARRYEYCSLAAVQAWSEVPPPRPLFESIVVLESYPRAARQGDLALAGLEFHEQTSYPLALVVVPGATLLLQAGYDPARCDPLAIDRALGTLEVLLDGLAAGPERPLDAVPLLATAERQQLLEWNDTRAAQPPHASLHEPLAAQAGRTPDAVAVVFEGGCLTYGELDRRAGLLARGLAGRGVRPGSLVAVCAERSLELVIGLRAVLAAGAAYLPLSTEDPPERLAFQLADAGAPVLLTQRRLLPRLPATGARVLLLDGPAPEPAALPLPAAGPADLAYAIYTSGSTGRPKGVLNNHAGILNRLVWMQRTYCLIAGDAVLQKTPYTFDVSVWEFFWPLMVGARLVMARPRGHQDPPYLVATIVAEGITTVHLVPAVLRAFLAAEGVERCRSLRRVIASGEALPADLVEKLHARLGAELHNLYGPTEAAIDVTAWRCRPGDTVVPIGRPIDNTVLRILDRRGAPLPAGAAGELHIGGINLARAYLARPDLTAERFVPDPCAPEAPGARLYRTGDLARWRPDGVLEYRGRIDHQVKVRGVRIEPGEVEAALVRHPAVREAVVAAREEGPGDVRLAAWVVARGEPGDLRDFLRRTLPEALVPSAFVRLDALPLTAAGKVDRRALPAPRAEGLAGRAAFVAPETALEREVAVLWQEVLRLDRVGRHDSFFDLGGHSLLLFQVHGLLRERLGREVPILDLFRHPTVHALARHLSGSAGEPEEPAAPAAPRPGPDGAARQLAARRRHRAGLEETPDV